jgi:hypothetical protein
MCVYIYTHAHAKTHYIYKYRSDKDYMAVLKQRIDDAVLQHQVVQDAPVVINSREEYINTVLAKRRQNITYQEDEVVYDRDDYVNSVLAEGVHDNT